MDKLETFWSGKSGFFLPKVDLHFDVFEENVREHDGILCRKSNLEEGRKGTIETGVGKLKIL